MLNRTPERAPRRWPRDLGVTSRRAPGPADLLVNCTSVGLEPTADDGRSGAGAGRRWSRRGSRSTWSTATARTPRASVGRSAAGRAWSTAWRCWCARARSSLERWTGREPPLDVDAARRRSTRVMLRPLLPIPERMAVSRPLLARPRRRGPGARGVLRDLRRAQLRDDGATEADARQGRPRKSRSAAAARRYAAEPQAKRRGPPSSERPRRARRKAVAAVAVARGPALADRTVVLFFRQRGSADDDATAARRGRRPRDSAAWPCSARRSPGSRDYRARSPAASAISQAPAVVIVGGAARRG